MPVRGGRRRRAALLVLAACAHRQGMLGRLDFDDWDDFLRETALAPTDAL